MKAGISSSSGIDPLDVGIHVENTPWDCCGAGIHALPLDEALITPTGTPLVLDNPDVCRGPAALGDGSRGGGIVSQRGRGALLVSDLSRRCSLAQGFWQRLVTNNHDSVIDSRTAGAVLNRATIRISF